MVSAEPGQTPAPQFYPSRLLLHDRPVLMVGAGAVADGLIDDLLAAGADVHAVAPAASAKINDLADAGRLSWSAREFVLSDLDRAWYVLAVTDSAQANAEVVVWAESRRIFCYRSDDPAMGTALPADS